MVVGSKKRQVYACVLEVLELYGGGEKKGCRSGRERTRDREVAMMDGGEDGGGGGGGGKEAEESSREGGRGRGRREKREER